MRAVAEIFKSIIVVLPQELRSNLVWIAPILLVTVFLEAVGLALVFPLVNAVTQPEKLMEFEWFDHVRAIAPDASVETMLITLTTGIALFYFLKNAFLLFAAYIENSFIMTAVWLRSTEMLRAYMAAPYPFHLARNSAELIRNVNISCDNVFRGVLKPVLRLVAESLVVVALFVVLILSEPVVTFVMAAFLASVLGAFYVATHRRITSSGRRSQVLHALVLQNLNQSLKGLKEIRVRHCEDFFIHDYARKRQEMSDIQVFNQTIAEAPRLAIEVLLVVAFVIAFLLIMSEGHDRLEFLPILAVFAFAGFRMMPAFNRIVLFANTIRFNIPALRDVVSHRDELKALSAARSSNDSAEPMDVADSIAFDGISFSYTDSEKPTLSCIDLTIRPNQIIGFVGPSGAGKSTLVDLLLGLLSPARGVIRVDGVEIGRHLARWQKIIGYIPQSVYVLDDSLRRNIALGIEDAAIDESAVRDAVRLARLDSVIADLPEGLDTVVGERGVRLSGGQRQRIGIARALYHRPQVLIMDEATSALDNETEREIADALADLHGKMTMIIIAHRLSTVRHCDMIVFMKEGRIVDTGTFADLYAKNADFRRMVELGELAPKAAVNA